jgi:hypothetical protein
VTGNVKQIAHEAQNLSFLVYSLLQILQPFLGVSEVTVVGVLVDLIPGFSYPLLRKTGP